jgi:V8-like Glu-specific endopeptidase
MTFPNGKQYSGTFSIVGRNDILTATHCVYQPDDGGLATKLDFYLAADYNKVTNRFEDYGYQFSVTPNSSNTTYFSSSFQDKDNSTLSGAESSYDIALIGLNFPIGDTYGYLNLNPLITTGKGEVVGYPSESTGMMRKDITFNTSNHSGYSWNTNTTPWSYEYSNWDIFTSSEELRPGNSGGPLLIGKYLAGVVSSGGVGSSSTFARVRTV